MKLIAYLASLVFLITACDVQSNKFRSMIIGDWQNRSVSVSFGSDGSYRSRIGASTYEGSWTIRHRTVMIAFTKSNSVTVKTHGALLIEFLTEDKLTYTFEESTIELHRPEPNPALQ